MAFLTIFSLGFFFFFHFHGLKMRENVDSLLFLPPSTTSGCCCCVCCGAGEFVLLLCNTPPLTLCGVSMATEL